MWVLKLKLKHNCTIGNRCEEFKVFSYSIPLGNWEERGFSYTAERHSLEGDPENVKRFLKDIKDDQKVTNL